MSIQPVFQSIFSIATKTLHTTGKGGGRAVGYLHRHRHSMPAIGKAFINAIKRNKPNK